MDTLKAKLNSLPNWVRNKYFITLAVYLVWLLFLSKTDVFNYFSLKSELNDQLDKKEYYEKEIVSLEQYRTELFSTNEALEKFAREQYYMKKKDEDLFIIK